MRLPCGDIARVALGICGYTRGDKHFKFSPLFGEDSHFDSYFSKRLKPPTSCLVALWALIQNFGWPPLCFWISFFRCFLKNGVYDGIYHH